MLMPCNLASSVCLARPSCQVPPLHVGPFMIRLLESYLLSQLLSLPHGYMLAYLVALMLRHWHLPQSTR